MQHHTIHWPSSHPNSLFLKSRTCRIITPTFLHPVINPSSHETATFQGNKVKIPLCCRNISSHDAECGETTGPCLLWGRVSTPCATSVLKMIESTICLHISRNEFSRTRVKYEAWMSLTSQCSRYWSVIKYLVLDSFWQNKIIATLKWRLIFIRTHYGLYVRGLFTNMVYQGLAHK